VLHLRHERTELLTERPDARREALNAETPLSALGQLITPAEQRFVRNHFPAPDIAQDHPVLVGGAVAHPLNLSPDELRAMHAITATITTECAGNGRNTLVPPVEGEQWGQGAIATAQWTGVPLRELLERAGLKETAVEILFAGADRGAQPGEQFVRSLPLEKALDPETMVSWEMNGAPIPLEFGGPLRLIVPGWYGMASVKWLERIEALEQPYSGTLQSEKYIYAPGAPVTEMRVKSIFTEPAQSSIVRCGSVPVRGLAWGGRGVARVDIAVGCTDRDWREARLLGPALPQAWRRFELLWNVSAPGRYVLRCRAVDVSGESQPDSPEWNALGYGANGVQQLPVSVV
jgi:DMSO/TMAO reductase YedYZ molybdopterin-dependent catalytic subunit